MKQKKCEQQDCEPSAISFETPVFSRNAKVESGLLDSQSLLLSILGKTTKDSKLYSKQIPEEAKVCSPEVQGNELAVHPPSCPKDLELYHFMVTAAQTALECHC
ncbi:hypothetical protein BTVI_53284 [Pitangus sulphuratus]|nr:hypothetical protein BTVI_53284 [Pitangus sulphuratus]